MTAGTVNVNFLLQDLNHEITLIPLQPPGDESRTFDPKPLFKELLQLEDEEAEELRRRATNSWEELEARLKGLEDKRRRLAALDFQLGKVSLDHCYKGRIKMHERRRNAMANSGIVCHSEVDNPDSIL